jgi:hypothetical protein
MGSTKKTGRRVVASVKTKKTTPKHAKTPKSGIVKIELDVQTAKTLLAALLLALGGGGGKKKKKKSKSK